VLLFHDATPAPGVEAPQPSPLIESIELQRQRADVQLRLVLPAKAVGYTLEHQTQPERWKLTLSRSVEALEAGRLIAFQMPGSRAGLKASRVVLDAGHGGPDAGAVVGQLREADLTLSLARQLKAELERGGDVAVILTRDADQEVTARRRAETANLERGDLFVSLHVDASVGQQDHGFEVYSWPLGAGMGESLTRITQKTVGAALEPWGEVPERFSEASDSLARNIAFSLQDVWPDGGRGARHRRLLPLEGVAMPSVMVECGVLTAGADAERLQSAEGQAGIVAALAGGIRRNLGQVAPPRTAGTP
jgi:N-acetylmuramoyl-L-alanine amidase